jgi:hypothetical protein
VPVDDALEAFGGIDDEAGEPIPVNALVAAAAAASQR